MTLEFNLNLKCRALDIVMDDELAERHYALQFEFLDRGIHNPRGGSVGPAFKDRKRIGSRMVFYLAEEFADEYVERISAPVPADEKGLNHGELQKAWQSKRLAATDNAYAE